MNYRHRFHAGNFADIFKHTLLMLLLQKLLEKDSPFFVLDTHAGEGNYLLENSDAEKTQEYLEGFSLLCAHLPHSGALSMWNQWLEYYERQKFYPGSPEIIAAYLRAKDRAALCEAHLDTYEILRRKTLLSAHNRDGISALRALLPPAEKRGLVFIDPSYEKEEEWLKLADALLQIHKKFSHGIYAIWYPIKNRNLVQKFLRAFVENPVPKIFVCEINLNGLLEKSNLDACGMMIINPPWKFPEQCQESVAALLKIWQINTADAEQDLRYINYWLIDESGAVGRYP
jgi:23S rRNA (adenine2030-N6)-methyltransferase